MPDERPNDVDATLAGAGPGRTRLARFAALGPGARFGPRYVLHERLGSGGAGEVFRATDTFAEAEVALKVLFPRESGPDADDLRGRLRREAQCVRALRHPNIVRVHDIGEQDGLLYLVMELLSGETLRQRLARAGRLAPDEAVRTLRPVLEALAAAHEAGVVHRDVKPGNIFFDREPGGGERTVLLDFGLARADADDGLTQTGQFLGTPEYVSPEQACGSGEVGPRSDLYSAGVVLWEMLAGTPPFTGSAVSVAAAHLQRPLPPARRALAGAPAWLRDLAQQLLEKDPARRPRDGRAALRRLDRRRRRGVFARRRGRAAGLVLAASGALALALGAAAVRLPRELVVDKVSGALLARASWGAPSRVPLPDRAGFVVPWGRRPWRGVVSLKGPENVTGAYRTARGYPWGLARVDALAGTVAPFDVRPAHWTGGLPQDWFPRFDMPPRVTSLARAGVDGVPLYAVLYTHPTHFPSLALLVDADGDIRTIGPHAGGLLDAGVVPAADGGRPLFVVAGENHDAGQRGVVCAAPVAAKFQPPVVVQYPPYTLGTLWDPAAWCVFLSDDRFARLRVEGTDVVVTGRASGARLRLDGRTGTPLDARDREGLTPAQWQAATGRILDALVRAAMTSERGDPGPAGALLLEAVTPRTPRALAGVARARAAAYLRRAGRLADALREAEAALRAEPAVLGHVRLQVDLLTRLGREHEARERILRGEWTGTQHGEVAQDLVVAALLAGRPETVDHLARKGIEPLLTDFYSHFAAAHLALHAGDGPTALAALTDPGNPVDGPDEAFRRALALALSDAPDAARAARDLAFAETGRGSGQALPLGPLRAFLAARAGAGWPDADRGPDPAGLRAARRDAAEAARDNLLDLYLLPWTEALAAGAARLAGDEPSATALFASARARPGAGPYIDRIEALARR